MQKEKRFLFFCLKVYIQQVSALAQVDAQCDKLARVVSHKVVAR